MKPARPRGVPCATARGALSAVALSWALPSCTLTLPLDNVSGGLPRPSSSYSFEEQTGNVVGDATGKRPGALFGDVTRPTWTRGGKRGGGLEFKDDGWVGVAALGGPAFPRRGTLAMWLNVRALPKTEDDAFLLFGCFEADDTSPLSLTLSVKGEVAFETSRGADARELTSPPLALGTWNFVVAGWDLDARQTYLSVRAAGAPSPFVATGDVPVGIAVVSPEVLFGIEQGVVDEVRFWDTLLSERERALLVD